LYFHATLDFGDPTVYEIPSIIDEEGLQSIVYLNVGTRLLSSTFVGLLPIQRGSNLPEDPPSRYLAVGLNILSDKE
jgi:hypothetical protein